MKHFSFSFFNRNKIKIILTKSLYLSILEVYLYNSIIKKKISLIKNSPSENCFIIKYNFHHFPLKKNRAHTAHRQKIQYKKRKVFLWHGIVEFALLCILFMCCAMHNWYSNHFGWILVGGVVNLNFLPHFHHCT